MDEKIDETEKQEQIEQLKKVNVHLNNEIERITQEKIDRENICTQLTKQNEEMYNKMNKFESMCVEYEQTNKELREIVEEKNKYIEDYQNRMEQVLGEMRKKIGKLKDTLF